MHQHIKVLGLVAIVSCVIAGCTSKSNSAQNSIITTNDQITLPSQPSNPASAAPLQTALNAKAVTTPVIATLTLSQTQQFTVASTAGAAVAWTVDGVAGGNSAVGTISSGGVYTAPKSPGIHSIAATKTDGSANTQVGQGAVAVTDISGVYTYHNDLARTGQNLQEYALTPAAVGSGKFGKRWSCVLDGEAYAQPLYIANFQIGGGNHNILIVATQHDSVYAIDADDPTCHTYWQTSFLGADITPMSPSDVQCGAMVSEIGITSTPVIDSSKGIVYVVAATKESGNFFQRLHALSVATGNEVSGSPVEIQASITNSSSTSLAFSAVRQLQRTALALSQGGVYIAWASNCDIAPYWGWVMRYDATSLSQTAVFNVTPNGSEGGIWMSGGAPAFDPSGNLYLTTGNGSFNNSNSLIPPEAPNNNFGESFIRLDPTLLTVKDFYTPSEEATWSSEDEDISSSGVTVLPDGMGPSGHPNLLVGADKQGHLWLIDRSNMQGFHNSSNPVVQFISLPNCTNPASCMYGTPTYWNGIVYAGVAGGPLMAFPLVNGVFSATSASEAIPAYQTAEVYPYPSTGASLSASPSGNGIVWTLDNSKNNTSGSAGLGTAILRAYDANSLGTALYSSSTITADAPGYAVKYTLPVIANGHVYVGGGWQLTVYGLSP